VPPYGVREVEKLLQLPRSTIRALVDAGFVKPAQGPRRAWQFSFQDLIVLRTAKALVAANVPRARILRSMRELRRTLPASMPLSGLSIAAEGDRVVVREGASRWRADSGQYLLAFGGDPAAGSLSVMARPEVADDNGEDPEAYIDAGVELHERGELAAAEMAYRDGLTAGGPNATALFNLGVLLEDMGRAEEAVDAYRAALKEDARLADCHYNLALLYESLQQPRDAIRHMAQYRRLAGKK
jgi:tetratricopeptide (TPR) repeat protein